MLGEKIKVYVDENIPLSVVKFMRGKLGWNVKFVTEEENLREKKDIYHHRKARKEGRYLLTRDRDYLDFNLFPLHRTGGIIILEEENTKKLKKVIGLLSLFIEKNRGTGLFSLPFKAKASLSGIEIFYQTSGENIKRDFYPWSSNKDGK